MKSTPLKISGVLLLAALFAACASEKTLVLKNWQKKN